ncbi:alpha-L-fucosidase [Flexithrix dorotheae]|uniref:alpha-L-fucosidase n=1 Tax=Flexithrix dorotheae TaxID=70993 RepID=UPI00036BEAE0|nr:alpha-L-fucosidase [Flexithrix dorotheae]
MKNNLLHILLGTLLLNVLGCASSEQKKDEKPAEETTDVMDKMEWWRDARFGMFVHWGPYAIPAGEHKGVKTDHIGEWIMNDLHIPIKEYEEYSKQFNPVDFNAEEWAALMKEAGMKYIVITTKHHDGFCLWDSKITDYDIMDFSPYKRDILEELAKACKKQGIALGFYHSIMDWHHPQAQAIWEPNYNKSRKDTLENPEFSQYYKNYLKPQVKELLTKYDGVKIIWFDGEWIPAYKTEMGKEMYQFISEINPEVIVNNRVDKGRQGMSGFNAEGVFAGDFGTPEQEIPDTGMPGTDWESCMTMNDTWGYKSFDHNWKSDTVLIQNLIDIVSKGGNFLLNVGPTAEGKIPAPSVERLKAMGKWMAKNSESIYGSSASPLAKPKWGRFTQKGDKIYAHVFNWPENGNLQIDKAIGDISKAYLLADKSSLELNTDASFLNVSLPETAPDGIATVVVLEKK